MLAELERLDETWPETPTVNIRVSVQLLKEWAQDEPDKMPRRIRLLSLGEPDAEGFYEPTLQSVYDE